MIRVLLLGGTTEARDLAALLVAAGIEVTSSLAGRVQRPRLPVGAVRIGGFGGAEGLAEHLRDQGVTHVVDATHPFAASISEHAVKACASEGVPLLRLEREGWAQAPGSHGWHWCADHDEAAATTVRVGSRPLLTVGRQPLDRFTGPLAGVDVVARVVDEPNDSLPEGWRLLRDRGPYDVVSERAVLADRDVLVTKDSGGAGTWPKMQAAGELGIPVVVVRRPVPSAGPPVVRTPEQVLVRLS